MRVRCPSPCLLNHSNTSLSTRRCTDVFPGGMTTRARFQKSSPPGAASGESARVLLAPRESFLLTALSEYLTIVFFCVMPVCIIHRCVHIYKNSWRVVMSRGPLARCRSGKRPYGFQFLGIFPPYLMNREGILQIQPELLGSAEILGHAGRHFGGHSPFLANNVVDRGRRDMQSHPQPVSGDAHRLQKLLPKNLSRMHRPTRRTFILDTHDFLPPAQ